MQTETEKVYAWERQIDELKKQRRDGYGQLLEKTKLEADYNALLIAGEYDKAAALQLERELKERNLKLSEAETAELEKQRVKVAEQNLARSQQGKAYDLYSQTMEASGKGRQLNEERALKEAREVKGHDLSEDESALVRRLAELLHNFSNRRETSYGDLSVSSNSLTARGGFQGGARMPDSEKLNREIANTSKLMLQSLHRLESISRNQGVF